MNLYEITKEMEFRLANSIDPETGEIIDDEAYAAFEMMEDDRDRKILSIAKLIKENKYNLEALQDRKRNLDKRMKTLKNYINFFEQYVLTLWDGEKLEDDEIQVKRNSNPSLVVDENLITDKYKFEETKIEKKVSQKLVKELLLKGEKIQGAYLKYSLGLK